TTSPAPEKLLPANVVGMPGFVPGVNSSDNLVIDKGTKDGIKPGTVAIYKNNVVGKITYTTSHLSTVILVTSRNFYLTAQTAGTSALGILQGMGGADMVLANVVLSDKLESGDIVVTKDDLDKNGSGLPADLVIGKIVSVSKRASSLFQSAKVQ